jgi:hypothetical protein
MSNDNNKIIDTLTEGHTRIRSKILEYPAASLEKVRDSLMAKFKLERYLIKKESVIDLMSLKQTFATKFRWGCSGNFVVYSSQA